MPFQLPEFTAANLAQVAAPSLVEQAMQHGEVPAVSLALALLVDGRAVATVVSDTTGDEITIQLKARTRASGSWKTVPVTEADRVYVDVPHAEGGGSTYIGTVYLHSGDFFYATNVDRSRVGAAIHVMRTAAGYPRRADKILPSSHCFACGRELRREKSVILGFGRKCAQRLGLSDGSYGNQHQAPGDESFGMADDVGAQIHDIDPEVRERGGVWPIEGRESDWREAVDRTIAEGRASVRSGTYADVGDINFPFDTVESSDLLILRPGADPRDLI